MKKDKTILEYCSVCDEELEMPIVQKDPTNPHLVWVRCPKCNETKPVDIAHIGEDLREEAEVVSDELPEGENLAVGIEAEVEEEDADELVAPPLPVKKPSKKKPSKKKAKEKESAPELVYKIVTDKAREYHPWENFQAGETILHPQWKQYGVVLRVRRSGGGRDLIEVKFEKAGEKRLLINQKAPSA